uniref:Ribonuclease H-like domain-containing protein n=1 Tax=Tanacetum cinerariifolium TaxID=118510 RepID=A0A6L2MRQ1_TANCI|nr:ribonuclease H-like domain-containing protein [Tanacetum cinerariifolium]
MAIMINSLDQGNPLHLLPNDSNCSSIVNIKLNGVENYRVWASAVKLALQIKNKMGFLIDSCLREILPEAKDDVLIIYMENSHRGIPANSVKSKNANSVKSEKPQVSAFVSRFNDNNNKKRNTWSWSNGNNGTSGNKRNYDCLLCKNCGLKGHTVDRCFELIGYPPGFKRNPNLKPANNNNRNSSADTKGGFMSNADGKTSASLVSLSNEHMLRLMSLLNDKSSTTANANMTGLKVVPSLTDLKKGKVLGTGSEFAGLYLFDEKYNVSSTPYKSEYFACYVSKDIWHNRLGHPANQVLLNLLKGSLNLNHIKHDLPSSKVSSPNDDEEGSTSGRDGRLHQPDPVSDNQSGSYAMLHQPGDDIVASQPGYNELQSATPVYETNSSEGNVGINLKVPVFQNILENQNEEVNLRRSSRTSKLPAKLNNYVLNNTARKPIGSRWVYKIKYMSTGEIERCLVDLAVQRGWKFYQMDVNNAFLYRDLYEDVYMIPPPGFMDKSDNRVCKLKRSLYGLKQDPRQWNHKLYDTLLEASFEQSKNDHSLYIKNDNDVSLFLLVYVDNLVITGNSEVDIAKFKTFLNKKFKMKDLGELKYFLGIEVLKTKTGLCLNQRKYCLELLYEFGLLACRPVLTPLHENIVLAHKETKDDNYLKNITSYQKLVGKVIYLCMTRPDISYSVHCLSQHMHAPLQSHFNLALRLLRYLKLAPESGIDFSKDNFGILVVAYSDSDWAKCLMTRMSVLGYCVFVNKSLVSWKRKKHPTLSKSSAEAEYRAMAATTCEVMRIVKILKDLGLKDLLPVEMHCDNKAAIQIAANPVMHEKTKHFDLDVHFVREKVASGLIKTVKVDTKCQVADIFTKALGSFQHNVIVKSLRMINITQFENAFNSEFKVRMQKYTRFDAQSFKDAITCTKDSIRKYMLEIILHQQRTSQLLKQKKLMQKQEDHSNLILALNVDSLKVDLVVIQNTCSEKEDTNSEIVSNKSVKESNLDSTTKDVHAIKYKMSKAKERCMSYFRYLHSHIQVLSKQDLKGTRIEHGFKRAFMSLFGQDADTFTNQKSHTQKHGRQIFTRHRFSPNNTSAVYEKTSPRYDLRWKPMGRIFKFVGLGWIPAGKLFNSCTSKDDSEPTHGSNGNITNIHESKQTLDLSAGTSINVQKEQSFDFSACTLYDDTEKGRLITTDQASNLNVRMTFEHISSSLDPKFQASNLNLRMTFEHNGSSLARQCQRSSYSGYDKHDDDDRVGNLFGPLSTNISMEKIKLF